MEPIQIENSKTCSLEIAQPKKRLSITMSENEWKINPGENINENVVKIENPDEIMRYTACFIESTSVYKALKKCLRPKFWITGSLLLRHVWIAWLWYRDVVPKRR